VYFSRHYLHSSYYRYRYSFSSLHCLHCVHIPNNCRSLCKIHLVYHTSFDCGYSLRTYHSQNYILVYLRPLTVKIFRGLATDTAEYSYSFVIFIFESLCNIFVAVVTVQIFVRRPIVVGRKQFFGSTV